MCWKQEWAAAIGNLEHAKEHIKHAQAKLLKRKLRNTANLDRLRGSKKHNYPSELERVQHLIVKNDKGIWECKVIHDWLETIQNDLYQMIKVYGITRSENPRRVRELMGAYVPKGGS